MNNYPDQDENGWIEFQRPKTEKKDTKEDKEKRNILELTQTYFLKYTILWQEIKEATKSHLARVGGKLEENDALELMKEDKSTTPSKSKQIPKQQKA